MRESVLSFIEKIKSDRKQRRKVLWLFCALAMFVAGGVFWRMRLIGITKTADPMCGISEHVHTEECIVSKILICGYDDALTDDPAGDPDNSGISENQYCDYEVHKHTEPCLGSDGSFICGYADYVIHSHDAECFDSEGNMICRLPEVFEHIHDDNCYEEKKVYLCDSAVSSETPLHAHSDSCYTTEMVLTCEIMEDENHTHSQGCYTEIKNLICGLSDEPVVQEHIHDETCPTATERVLICDRPEVIFHLHNKRCYDDMHNLICGMIEVDEHQHDEFCTKSESAALLGEGLYDSVSEQGELSCGFTAHSHDPFCYDADGKLICGFSDAVLHFHDVNCFDGNGSLVCRMPEITEHIHTPLCYSETQRWSCGLEEGEAAVVHTHTTECYDAENQLICTIPETEPHIHNDNCILETVTALTCTQQEITAHTHSAECYDENGFLICGKLIVLSHQHDASCRINNITDNLTDDITESEKPKHIHTDECYEIIYGCGLLPHFHSIMCYADIKADIETADVWKSTLPAEVSEFRDENVVNIARSQLGYTESKRNFTLDDQGVRRGYSRYGEWYGNPYGEWNSMFAAFCLNYGGFTREEIPYNSGAYAWVAQLKEKDILIQPEGEYEAIPGDIVFYDTDGDGYADRVGIVSDAIDGGFITIEGDYCDGSISEPYIDESVIQSVINANHGDDIVRLGNESTPAMNGDGFDYDYNYDYDEFGTHLLGGFGEAGEFNPNADVILDEPKTSYIWNDDNIPTHYVAAVTHYYAEGNIIGYVRLAASINDEAENENDLLKSFGQVYVPYDGDYTNLEDGKKYAIVNVDESGNKNALTIGNDSILSGTAATTTEQEATVNNATKWQLVKNDNGFFLKVSGQDKYLAYNKNTKQLEFITNSQIFENGNPYSPNFEWDDFDNNGIAKFHIKWTEDWSSKYLSFDSSLNGFTYSTNDTGTTFALNSVDGSLFDGYPYDKDLYISVGDRYLTDRYIPAVIPQTTCSLSVANGVMNNESSAWGLFNSGNNAYKFAKTIGGVKYYLANNNGQLLICNESDAADYNTVFEASLAVPVDISTITNTDGRITFRLPFVILSGETVQIRVTGTAKANFRSCLTKAAALGSELNQSNIEFIKPVNGSFDTIISLSAKEAIEYILFTNVNSWDAGYSADNVIQINSINIVSTTKEGANNNKFLLKAAGSDTYLTISNGSAQLSGLGSASQFNIAQYNGNIYNNNSAPLQSLNNASGAQVVLFDDNNNSLYCQSTTSPSTPAYLESTTIGTQTIKVLREPEKYDKWTISKLQLKEIKDGSGNVTGHFQTYAISKDGQYIELPVSGEKGDIGTVGLRDSSYALVIEKADNGYRIRSDNWGRNYLFWNGQEYIDNVYASYSLPKDYNNNVLVNFYDSSSGQNVDAIVLADGSLQLPEGEYIIVISNNTAVTLGSTGNILKDTPFGKRAVTDNELWTFAKMKYEQGMSEPERFDERDCRIKSVVTPFVLSSNSDNNSLAGIGNANYQTKSAIVPYTDWNGNSGMLIMAKTNDGAKDSKTYLVRNSSNEKYYWKTFDGLSANDPDSLTDDDKKLIASSGGFFQLYYQRDKDETNEVDHVNLIVATGSGTPSGNPKTPYELVLRAGDKVTLSLINGQKSEGVFESYDDSNVRIFALKYDGTAGDELTDQNFVDCGYYDYSQGGFPYTHQYNYTLEAKNPGEVQIQISTPEGEKAVYINVTVLPKNATDSEYYNELKKTCTGKYYEPNAVDGKSKRYFHLDVEIEAKFDINVYRPDGSVVSVEPQNVRVVDVYTTVYNTAALINDNYKWNEDYIYNRNNSGMTNIRNDLLTTYQNPMGTAAKDLGNAADANWLKESGKFVYNENYMSEYDPSNPDHLSTATVDYNGKTYAVDLSKVYADYQFINPHETVFTNIAFPNLDEKPVMAYDVHYNPGKVQDNGQYEFLTAGWGWLELYDGDTAILHATIEYEYNGKTYRSTQDVTRLICDTTNICPSGYSSDLPIQGYDIDVFMNDTDQFESTEFIKVDQYGERVTGAQFTFYRNAQGENYQITEGDKLPVEVSDAKNGVFHFTVSDVVNALNDQKCTSVDEALVQSIIGSEWRSKFESDQAFANSPLTMNQLYKFLGERFVIVETLVPDGYRKVGERINMRFIGSPQQNSGQDDNRSSNIFLICDNAVECGVHTDPNGFITAPKTLESASSHEVYHYIVNKGSDEYEAIGKLYAVVAKRDGIAPGAADYAGTMNYDQWTPIYGNLYDGYQYMNTNLKVTGNNLEDVKTLIRENKGIYQFEIDPYIRDVSTVSAKNLPGDIRTYISYIVNTDLKNKNPGESEYQEALNRLEYAILFYYSPSGAEDLSDLVRVANYAANSQDHRFTINWSATVNIPNIENRIFFRKTDTDGHPLNNAGFALYHAGDPGANEIAKVKAAMADDYADIFTNAYYLDGNSGSRYHYYLGDITTFNSGDDKGYAATGNCIVYDTQNQSIRKTRFGIDYTFWGSNMQAGYVTKPSAGQIHIYASEGVTSEVLIIPASKKIGNEYQSYVGYTHSGSSDTQGNINASECAVVAEDGTGHFGKIKNGKYILREIKPPTGFNVNNKAQTLVLVNDAGVFANGGEVGDGVSVMNGVGYLVSTLQSHASRGSINETLRWIYSALRINNTDTFNGFYNGISENDNSAVRNAVTSWPYAKPANDEYIFANGGKITRRSWAMNPEGSGSPTSPVEMVVFNNPDGQQFNDLKNSWDFFGTDNYWNRDSSNCLSVNWAEIKPMMEKGGMKFVYVYSADRAGNPTLNLSFGGQGNGVSAPFTVTELGNGKYEATISLDDMVRVWTENGLSLDTHAEAFLVQVETSNFKLYSAKFISSDNTVSALSDISGSAANFMAKVQSEVVTSVPNGLTNDNSNIASRTRSFTYYSNEYPTLKREATVVLPPDYDPNEKYPVMYLLHGMQESINSMMNDHNTANLLMNMMEKDEAKKMILVYCNVFAKENEDQKNAFDGTNGSMVQAYNRFIYELKEYLMPAIKNAYPAIADGRENTAIFGFSLGGRESLAAGFTYPDLIGYIGAAAPAPGLVPATDGFGSHNGQFKSEDELKFQNQRPYLLMIGGGTNDTMVADFPKQYHDILTKNQTDNVWIEIQGGSHDRSVILPTLYNFAKHAFKAEIEETPVISDTPAPGQPIDNSNAITEDLKEALVTYLEYQPLVISADYNLWQDGSFKYTAPDILKSKAARSLFNYETNLHINKEDFDKLTQDHLIKKFGDYPALEFKKNTEYTYTGIHGNSWTHTFAEDRILYGNEARYNKRDEQLSNKGSRTLRLTTDYGWSSLSVYQDYAWATAYYLAQDGKQLTEYTSYVDANGIPRELTQLYSNSTFVQVVDEISTYLTIIKRGDTNGNSNIDSTDRYMEGAEFILYQDDEDSRGKFRKYYCMNEAGVIEYVEQVLDDNGNDPLGVPAQAYRFVTGNDGKGAIRLSFSQSGTYYLQEVKAPRPYGIIGRLKIEVELSGDANQSTTITITGSATDGAKTYKAETITSSNDYKDYYVEGTQSNQYAIQVLDPKNYRLELEKVDAENDAPLTDAEFRVFKVDENQVRYYYKEYALNGTVVTTNDVNQAKVFKTEYETTTIKYNGTKKTLNYTNRSGIYVSGDGIYYTSSGDRYFGSTTGITIDNNKTIDIVVDTESKEVYVTNLTADEGIYMDIDSPSNLYKLTVNNGINILNAADILAYDSIYRRAFISIEGLANTTTEVYYIEEIKPPIGYYPLKDLIEVDFSGRSHYDQGLPKISIGGKQLVVSAITRDDLDIDSDGIPDKGIVTGYRFKVENHAGYELPETGGIGTHYYTFGGLLLIVIPLVYGFVRRRRYGKEVRG